MSYSNTEYCDMLQLYWQNNASATVAARVYAEKFPNRRHLDKNVIKTVVQRLRDTGSLAPNYSDNGKQRTSRVPAFEERVLREFRERPRTSTRAVARDLGSNHTTVLRVLHGESMHPYKYTSVQELLPRDYGNRLQFCRWLLAKHGEDNDFINCILFSDESMFDKNGVINMRNDHLWAESNPHVIREQKSQYKWSVNLWAGIIRKYLIGPCILPSRLTGHIYAEFLENQLPDLLEDVPLEIRQKMWLQHDGAAPHNAATAKGVLHCKFPGKWIGRGGPIPWPARSPDLNPLDFFFWRALKEKVYTERQLMHDQEELAARLDVAITEITPDVVASFQTNLLRRARACIDAEGDHMEHIYNAAHP
ncbi:histone-lysine N-methyltransferase SETMAR-like [Prorops nasuta]|uniref:histone-lysine N-methyltransferase SETMAR-like n=1 Tax=Prorops nasuta TaxID=863751 RepID=UPI0034CD338C